MARAAVDEQFRKRLVEDAAAVFAEFGIKLDRPVDLNKDFTPGLDAAVTSLERQRAQVAASSYAIASAGAYGQSTGTLARSRTGTACRSRRTSSASPSRMKAAMRTRASRSRFAH